MGTFRRLACALLLAGISPLLAARWVEPGEKVSLSPNEGLALFIVDSDGSLSNIRIDKIGSVFTAPVLKDLGSGRKLRLLTLEQGDYQLDKALLYWGWTTYSWNMDDVPNRAFHVEAGKINYVGDLKIQGQSIWRQMSIRNGGLRAFDALETQFPGLRDRYPWRYAGEFPDPFVEYYKQVRAGRSEPATLGDPEPPRPGIQQKDLASLLFRESPLQGEALSPSGRYVLSFRSEGNVTNVYALDLTTHASRLLLSNHGGPSLVAWLADDLLAIDYLKSGERRAGLFQFKQGGEVAFAEIPANGWVYSPGTGNGGVIFVRKTEDNTGLELHMLGTLDLDTARELNDRMVTKLASIHGDVKNDRMWWFDAAGVPRLAMYADGDKVAYEYYAPGSGDQGEKFTVDDPAEGSNDHFEFAGFDHDGKLLAISNRGRPQADLVEFDARTRQEGAVRFSREGVDVIDSIWGTNGEVVGVQIKNDGRLQQVPFGDSDATLQRSLESALPGRSVGFGPPSKNGNRLVFSYGPKDPGSYFLFNDSSKKLDLLDLSAEQLEGRPLLDTRRFVVKSQDGFDIEAFLTLPTLTASEPPSKPSLLVMPHGGPIGVFDTERFDPEVQYFAQLGFAVLQVNYRGSGGGGTAATNRGMGQYGRQIEADVDAVVDNVVASGQIDATRIVAMGTSYGGYSALMLSLLHPKRYKAAVSIAGVTDLLAQFSGGDITLSKRASKWMVKAVGDPRTDADSLKALSPVYRYTEFSRPIMLVHDRGDERVSSDQSERLRRLLALRGTPATTVFVQDNVHGLANATTAIDVYPKIAAFLLQALSTPAGVAGQ